MRWPSGLLGSPHDLALVGGRAPLALQRQMARDMARLNALQRASAWIEMLCVACPALRDGPLLGRHLAALTNQVDRSTEARSEEGHLRVPRLAWPEHSPARNQALVSASERPTTLTRANAPRGPIPEQHPLGVSKESLSRRPSSIPPELERQASQALLGRLAGETVLAGGLRGTRRRPAMEALVPETSAPPAVSQDPASRRGWLYELARRAERSLHQGGPEPSGAPAGVASDRPRPGTISSLADQWTLPLVRQPASVDLMSHLDNAPVDSGDRSGSRAQPWGTPQSAPAAWSLDQPGLPGAEDAQPQQTGSLTAAPDLLARLAGVHGTDSDSSGAGAWPWGTPQSAPSAWSLDQPGLPGAEDAQPQQTGNLTAAPDLLARLAGVHGTDNDSPDRKARLGSASRRPAATRSQDWPATAAAQESQPWPMSGPSPGEDASTKVPSAMTSQRRGASSELKAQARIAPSLAADSLPPLFPPQMVGLPSSSAEAATIRQSTRQEDVIAQDDLSALAAKVKRILDEEARRHGIDV